jgi:nucleoside-diphosphate-sugar epimerase
MRRYFLTGATGFIGRELVRQLLTRSDTESIVCLTRGHRTNLIKDARIEYLIGDICDCRFPNGSFTDLIHGANEVNDLLQPDQLRYYYTIVEGTNRILKWAATNPDPIERILILSSGAVSRDTIYGRAKRHCEILARNYGGNTKIARIFSVIGKEMPLNGQYAAGRFVGQAIREKRIQFYGGTSVRTYLDVSDCAQWLLEILKKAPSYHPIDVAGNDPIHVGALAQLTGMVFSVPVTRIEGPDRSDEYLPDLTAAESMGLHQILNLTQSLEKIRDFLSLCNTNLEPAA